ncbi:MAG: gliding motility-associated protein GldE [Bacteroidetes bacterium]|nr:gliding motility-associated protein GldE [Bacteroidota bacterium]
MGLPGTLLLHIPFVPILGVVVKSFSISVAVSILSMLVLLVFVSLVSAAESAFFSLSPVDMEELKESDAKRDDKILLLINTPKRLLATLLISINFINIAIVILSTYVFDELFDFTTNPLLGFIIQVVAVTFLILLIGEVIPKIYATQNPLKTSRTLLLFVQTLQKIFYPISSVLVMSTSLMDKIVKPKSHNISVDELSQALELTSDEDIPEEDHKILQGIVKFGNTDVKQIMKSRMDVTAFEHDLGFKKLLENITHYGFSRVPIYKETIDHIAGVLYTKDLLPYLDEGNDFNWQGIIRPPFFVPENKKIDDLLREFQYKKIHLAVVVDEYGGTSGIVTLEDVIEEIVGEINDEFDDDDLVYSKLDDNNYVFEGKAHLNDVYRILEIDGEVFEDAKGEADTLGGLILELEERIPKKGERIKFENLTFTIEAADNRKIKRVKVTIVRIEEDED